MDTVALYGCGTDCRYSVPHLGIRATLQTKPSADLLNDLRNLPQGRKVGIAYAAEMCADGRVLEPVARSAGLWYGYAEHHQTFYWQAVLDHLNQYGLEPVFLDEAETLKEIAARTLKAEAAMQEADNIRSATLTFPFELEALVLAAEDCRRHIRRANKERTTVDYLWTVARTEKMLDEIARQKPDVVLMEQGYTDFCFHRQQTGRDNTSVVFGPYAKEEVDRENIDDKLTLQRIFEGLPVDPIPGKLTRNASVDMANIEMFLAAERAYRRRVTA